MAGRDKADSQGRKDDDGDTVVFAQVEAWEFESNGDLWLHAVDPLPPPFNE